MERDKRAETVDATTINTFAARDNAPQLVAGSRLVKPQHTVGHAHQSWAAACRIAFKMKMKCPGCATCSSVATCFRILSSPRVIA